MCDLLSQKTALDLMLDIDRLAFWMASAACASVKGSGLEEYRWWLKCTFMARWTARLRSASVRVTLSVRKVELLDPSRISRSKDTRSPFLRVPALRRRSSSRSTWREVKNCIRVTPCWASAGAKAGQHDADDGVRITWTTLDKSFFDFALPIRLFSGAPPNLSRGFNAASSIFNGLRILAN
ncbi:MAG: hypothetical protein CL820_13805 [Croceicoccus sp.]|nr:hypothetical protein [Croceicoccus sp.]MAL26935.1 hypothetical protein [Croceicoccus sp.]